jgi:hypothetical protein
MGAMNPFLVQDYYRIRDDTGAVTGTPNWVSTENQSTRTDFNVSSGDVTFRIRIVCSNTGAANANSPYALYVSKNSGAYAAATTGSTSGVHLSSAASSSADAAAIATGSFVLTAGTGVATAGEYDDSGQVDANLPYGDYFELEFGLNLDSANLSDGDTFDFRVYYNGAAFDSYATNATALVSVTKAGSDAVTLDDAESNTETTSTALGQVHGLALDDAQSATEAATIPLGQEHGLAVDDTESNTEASTVTLGITTPITLDDAESATEVDGTALGQAHTLSLVGVDTATEASATPLGQEHQLLVDDVEGATEAGTTPLGQTHDLLLTDVDTASETSSTPLGSGYTLDAGDVEATSEVTDTAIGQAHALAFGGAESASEVSKPTVGEISNQDELLLDDAESATEAGAVVLGQVHGLLADDVQSTSETFSAEFGSGQNIELDDVESASETGSTAIGQIHNLALSGSESATEAGSLGMGGTNALLVDDAETNTEAGAITVSQNVQILRPDGDDVVGNWTTQADSSINLYQSIDEVTPNDTDYIQSEFSPDASAVKLSLSNQTGGANPSAPHILRYRYYKIPSAATQQIDLTVRLLEGLTEIASWSHSDIGTTVIQVEQTLTSPQVGAISNYSDLHLEFEGDAV